MDQLTLDQATGIVLKAHGQAAIEATDPAFVAVMRETAKRISRESGFVSADNLRVVADRLGIAPKDPHSWGVIFKGKGWTIIGHQKSALPSNHSRLIAIWRYE